MRDKGEEVPFFSEKIRRKSSKKSFQKFFEKSLDIFKKSVIIDNVKREGQMTNKKMGGDLSAV
nr:MAG TPA: hypothetical protein [Caudoviricetes sp.]